MLLISNLSQVTTLKNSALKYKRQIRGQNMKDIDLLFWYV